MITSIASVRSASAQTLTFEGLKNNEPIANYYNGGLGGLVSGPGPNDGVIFSSNALALISHAAGGSGNFSGEPSPSTVAYFLSGSSFTADLVGGFTSNLSYYYVSASPGTVTVYSGLDGTGTVLGSNSFSATPNHFHTFEVQNLNFTGTGRSVVFGGQASDIGYDNVTFGAVPAAVPEPSALAVFGLAGVGLLGLTLRARKRLAA